MGISHVKSNIIADFTGTVTVYNSQGSTTTVAATNLVVPSDWNSAHNLTYNLGGNTSNTTQVAGTDVQFHGAGAVTVHGTGSTISFNVPVPVTLSSYVPFEVAGANSVSVALGTATSGIASFFPVSINEYVSAGMMNMVMNASFTTVGTSSGRQSAGVWYAMYSRGTGTNSTTMGTVDSASFSWAITGNNSSYTISQPTSTDFGTYTYSTTSSAGSNISSGYTGSKLVQFPVNVLMSPGVYWIGLLATKSTSSVNLGMSLFVVGGSMTETGLAPIGSYSSDFSTGTAFAGLKGGPWQYGHGSFTSANQINLPVSVAYSALTAGPTMVPYMKFWRT